MLWVLTALLLTDAAAALPVSELKAPLGFTVSVWSDAVPGARSLALASDGTVFVGTRRQGKVYALKDDDGDGRAEARRVVAKGLTQPNGVAVRGGDLFVAEVSRILRLKDAAKPGAPPKPEVVSEDFPSDRAHGWKFIAFGPDGKLYVPVGAPCNICLSNDPRYAAIHRVDPLTGAREVFASGVRNTVGFDWKDGSLWFTDNGRDWLGDDAPPDELNAAPKAGLHFGYPFCHGGTIPDPEFGDQRPCRDFVAPKRNLTPHGAALGLRFYDGEMFPSEMRGVGLIAEHGSWNRSTPIGYRVMKATFKDGRVTGYEPFITGWLKDGRAWGRPVDVLVLRDGSLLVSDDEAGAIYRVAYKR